MSLFIQDLIPLLNLRLSRTAVDIVLACLELGSGTCLSQVLTIRHASQCSRKLTGCEERWVTNLASEGGTREPLHVLQQSRSIMFSIHLVMGSNRVYKHQHV